MIGHDGLGWMYNEMGRIGFGNENGPTSNLGSTIRPDSIGRIVRRIHSRAVTSLRRATEADYAPRKMEFGVIEFQWLEADATRQRMSRAIGSGSTDETDVDAGRLRRQPPGRRLHRMNSPAVIARSYWIAGKHPSRYT